MRAFLFPLAIIAALACTPALQQSPTTQTDTPKPGGILRDRESSAFTDMDPTTAVKSEAGMITNAAYNSLLGFKSGPGIKYDELTLQPELAERWDVSPDAKTYTFHLRKGVKFADLPPVNGRELTSEDVKFSFEYFLRTGPFKDKKLRENQYGFQLEGMDRVDTPGPYTVVVRFKEPFVPFLNYAGTAEQNIFAKEIYQQDGDFSKQAVGTGPWQWDPKASQTGTRLVFKKNPTYWDAGKPHIDEVHYVHIPDEAAAYAAFKTKQVDLLRSVRSIQDADDLRKGSQNPQEVEYFETPGRLYPNVTKAPLNDIRVRRAINLAMDREEYIKTFSNGRGKIAPAGAEVETFTREEAKQMLRYDPEESKRLLREAGFPNGGPDLEVLYTQDYGQLLVSWIQLFQAQMKRVGVNVTLKNEERTTMSRNRRDGNYQLSPSPFTTLQPEIDGTLFAMFHPASNANYGRVNDPTLTAMIEATRKEPDPAKRQELVRGTSRYINEHTWGIAFYFGPEYIFWQSHLKGFAPNKGNRGRLSPEAWLDK